MKHRKLAGILVSLSLALSLPMVTFAAPPADAAADAAPIVILHTNDVHCGIDDAIGYAGLAAYKAEMEAAYGAPRHPSGCGRRHSGRSAGNPQRRRLCGGYHESGRL